MYILKRSFETIKNFIVTYNLKNRPTFSFFADAIS